jgi:hypothetical protein
VFDSLKAKTAMLAGAALLVTSLAASIAPASAHDKYEHKKPPTISQNQDQDSFGNSVFSLDLNESEIEDEAFENAKGVIQVNQASGVGNQQDNLAYVDGGSKKSSGYALKDRLSQDAGFNGVVDINGLFGIFGGNETSIEDDAFANATGLVQVNQAAGNLNQNGNDVAITDRDLASSKVRLHQGLFVNCVYSETSNSATITDNAFDNFSGVAQINQASGDLNQNKNQLSVAH